MKTGADSPSGVHGPNLGQPDCCAARYAPAGNIFILVLLLIAVVGLLVAAPTQAREPEPKETERVVKVGPQREIKTLREASRIAQAGRSKLPFVS